MKIDQQEKNLGTLKFGKDYRFHYTLSNDSNKDIIIKKVYAGCSSCTKVNISKSLVKPNEKCLVNVTFTPGSTGIQTKKIVVQYQLDGKNSPDIILTFKSIVNE